MDKQQIVQAILEQLGKQFESRRSSSQSSRAAGNDEESRAEDKHDTRSTEENYLADGLAKQALAASQAAAPYEKMLLPQYGQGDAIDLAALVALELPGGKQWFFLGPSAGGLEVEYGGETITVITRESPLGSQLMGKTQGDTIAKPPARIVQVL